MKQKLLYLFLYLIFSNGAFGQQKDSLSIDEPTINKSKLRAAIITESAFYIGGMSYLQFVWYKDSEQVSFHWHDHKLPKTNHEK